MIGNLKMTKDDLDDAIKKATEKGLPKDAELGILGEYNVGSPTIWITRQQYEDLRGSISPSGDVPRSSQGKVVWNAEKGCFEANRACKEAIRRFEK